MTNTNTPRQLRDYQQTARDRVDAEWATGITRTAIVWPTGCGKTDFIADACIDEVMAGGRVLVLAHRSELLDQLIARIAGYSPLSVGRIQAGHNDINHSIIVATVQTMCRPKRQAALNAIEWEPTLVVIDEVHHALAKSYLVIVKWAGCFGQRKTKLLGVTATLARGDRQAFDGLFQSVADVISYDRAFDRSLLIKPVVKTVRLDKFWDRFRFGELTPDELMEQDCRRTVQQWLRKAQNRITIAYCPTIKRAACLTAAFEDAHVPVALVIGKTPYEDRKVIYKKLATGDIRVMVNVGVATEGFDCPPASCILLDRAPQSAGTLIQILGRGLRPYTDPVTGRVKTDCLVLDTTGVTNEFDLTTLIDIDPHCIRTQRRNPFQRLWDSLARKERVI